VTRRIEQHGRVTTIAMAVLLLAAIAITVFGFVNQ